MNHRVQNILALVVVALAFALNAFLPAGTASAPVHMASKTAR